MTRSHRRKRSTEGFTLFELAIVILIMGGMAAMIAPGLSEQMADARAAGAAEELVRLHRLIRARVNSTALAHLFWFQATNDAAGSNGLGNVRVWEGMNNRCSLTPWMWTINGDPDDGHQIIDGVDMGDSAYNLPVDGADPGLDDIGRQIIRIQGRATTVILCFEPGGATYTGVVDAGAPDVGFVFTPQTVAETFTVTRSITIAGDAEADRPRGVPRTVVFPAGGNGRLRF